MIHWEYGLVIRRIVILIYQQKRHHRTFSEDDGIQAQENVKKVEDDDVGEISEPEDQMMLQRDAKDWKVTHNPPSHQLPKPSSPFALVALPFLD